VGISPWQFLQLFGRQLPGGGIGETGAEDVQDPKARWNISGKLGPNCLACHAADRMQDGAAWATASSFTSGFG
jgi:hypothetical protein